MSELPRFDDTAACLSIGVNAFFSADIDENGGSGRGRISPAIEKVCGDCPWHDPCYDYALHHDVQGIWGGTSHRQRMRTRRDIGLTPIPVVSYWDHREQVAS